VVLRDVFCNSAVCFEYRDVDLCREPDFVSGELRCDACQEPYDRDAIEQVHTTD